MAQETRTQVKTYFETGDTPTQVQFVNMLDSVAWYDEHPTVPTVDSTPTDGSSNAVSSNGVYDALALKADTSDLTTKADLVGGKVPASQIPDVAISSYLGQVASQAAMTALSGQVGDWCIRTDDSKVYIITGADATVAGNWTALSYPVTAPSVTSFNGRTGAITPSSADYSSYYVPVARTVNSKALSSNITLNAADIGLGSVPNTDATTRVNHTGARRTLTSGTTNVLSLTDEVIYFNPDSDTILKLLPAAATTGRRFVLVYIGQAGYSATINTDNTAEKINGAASLSFSYYGYAYVLESDGSHYWIVASNVPPKAYFTTAPASYTLRFNHTKHYKFSQTANIALALDTVGNKVGNTISLEIAGNASFTFAVSGSYKQIGDWDATKTNLLYAEYMEDGSVWLTINQAV